MNKWLFNTEQSFWKKKAKKYRSMISGGPTLRVLEGDLFAIFDRHPRTYRLARFETTEEAERVLLAAGFKFVEVKEGFRA